MLIRLTHRCSLKTSCLEVKAAWDAVGVLFGGRVCRAT